MELIVKEGISQSAVSYKSMLVWCLHVLRISVRSARCWSIWCLTCLVSILRLLSIKEGERKHFLFICVCKLNYYPSAAGILFWHCPPVCLFGKFQTDWFVEEWLNYGPLFVPNYRAFVRPRPEPYLSMFLEFNNKTSHKY